MCSFCVGGLCKLQTLVPTILSTQDLMDNVIKHYPEDARMDNNGNIRLDRYNCYGMRPESALKFVHRAHSES